LSAFLKSNFGVFLAVEKLISCPKGRTYADCTNGQSAGENIGMKEGGSETRVRKRVY